MSFLVRALPVIAILAIAGCGGDSDSGAGPLDNALGYLPEDAPLVITIDTDVEGGQFKSIDKIADRFPFAGQIKKELQGRLESGNVSFDDDVKPLLGNEFVVGATDVNSLVNRGSSGGLDGGGDDDDEFVGAIQVEDKGKLEELIKKEGEDKGEESGAKIYEDNDGDAFAIEDDVLVVADSRERLNEALEQRDGDDRLTEKKFNQTVDGLPKEALVKLGGNLERLIASDPESKAATKVKWVAALRTFGAALSFKDDRVDLDFKLATDGGELSDEDLPLATGDQSPGVLDLPKEIGVGLRNPAQVFRFGESAVQAVEPAQYADYQQTKAAAERRLGIDIDEDLIAQLEGDASVSVSTGGDVGVRIELADEAKFSDTLGEAGEGAAQADLQHGRLAHAANPRRRRDRAAQRRRRQRRLSGGGRRDPALEQARAREAAGRGDPEGSRRREGRARGERERRGAVPRGATQPGQQPRRRPRRWARAGARRSTHRRPAGRADRLGPGDQGRRQRQADAYLRLASPDLQIRQRVDRLPAAVPAAAGPDLEVQVCAERAAGVAHLADLLARCARSGRG